MVEKVHVSYGKRDVVVVQMDTAGLSEKDVAEKAAFIARGYCGPAHVGQWTVNKGVAEYTPAEWI